jgi:hypothetical protein
MKAEQTPEQIAARAPVIEWTPSPKAEGSYRVGHSLGGHPADGLTAKVHLGDGAYSTILNPQSLMDGGLIWCLTYWCDFEPLRHTAASVAESYDYLISDSISMAEATRRLRLLRNARKALKDSQ